MTGETWRGAAPAELSWVAGVPRSEQFDDTYFSSSDGVAESRHVFLAGNGLPDRWCDRDRFTIVETGFGTGLNFLSTWQAWQVDRRRPRQLHYVSVEAFPLRREDLARALSPWEQLAGLAGCLTENYPPALPGLHRLVFDNGRLCLDLIVSRIEDALPVMLEMPDFGVDAWYLDGFAPARNPAMWTDTLFRAMAVLGRGGCRFATFTAAGSVRRGLDAAGFAVQKTAGYGRKREMLCGELRNRRPREKPSRTPWHLPAARYPAAGTGELHSGAVAPGRALVLGAGLAGASVAGALARRGWEVAVYDQDTLASGASGNQQGVLYTRLSHRRSPLTEFSLHSFVFAARSYRQMFAEGRLTPGTDGALCGAVHLQTARGIAEELLETVASLPELARQLDAAAAGEISGLPGCPPGLFYPDAGWLHPPAVCRALLGGQSISLHQECGALRVEGDNGRWSLVDGLGRIIDTAEVAVIACGHASAELAGVDWLRLRAIRGQTTQIASSGELRALSTVLCHEGYIAPAMGGEHCIGATFDVNDPETGLRTSDHRANIEQLQQALPNLVGLEAVDIDQLTGRTGFRCASPDYLPIVGPLPSRKAFCDDYALLRRNAKRMVPRPGAYSAGLYLNTGHGSRGLTSTPLSAELLAAQISGEPWPLPVSLARALSPARFLIRDLVRGRL